MKRFTANLFVLLIFPIAAVAIGALSLAMAVFVFGCAVKDCAVWLMDGVGTKDEP